MAIRYSNPKIQYFYVNGSSFGEPLVDGFVYFYDSGTLNLKDTYADSGLSIVNPNPMRLDGAGRISAPFLDGNYRVIVQDNEAVQQFELDPIQGSLSGGQWEDWDITTTYSASDLVRGSDNFYYKSITNNNLGNNPVSSASDWSQILFIVQWNEFETYSLNDNVIQDGTQYKSLVDDNLNNPPISSPAEWGAPTGGIVAGNPVSLLTNDVPYLEAGNNLDDVADLPATLINIGLDQVDNTSDLDKPVSTATQTALDLKANTADVYDKTEVYPKSEVYTKTESNANYYATGSKVNDSNLLDGLDSTYFRNASNLNTGTVSDSRLPSAATNDKGIVQLSTSVSSTSTTLAATSSAVRTAYNAAIAAAPSTSFGAVGTYVLGRRTENVTAGSTYTGITAGGLYTASGSTVLNYSAAVSLSGTWRAMGTVDDAGPGGNVGYTLYVRIA